jgi:hypothetical protein
MLSAAKLLTGAPGLGWSQSEHPGHLLFPMFCRLLGNEMQDLGLNTGYGGHRGMDMDELELLGWDRNEPRLKNPSVDDILALVGIAAVEDARQEASDS